MGGCVLKIGILKYTIVKPSVLGMGQRVLLQIAALHVWLPRNMLWSAIAIKPFSGNIHYI